MTPIFMTSRDSAGRVTAGLAYPELDSTGGPSGLVLLDLDGWPGQQNWDEFGVTMTPKLARHLAAQLLRAASNVDKATATLGLDGRTYKAYLACIHSGSDGGNCGCNIPDTAR